MVACLKGFHIFSLIFLLFCRVLVVSVQPGGNPQKHPINTQKYPSKNTPSKYPKQKHLLNCSTSCGVSFIAQLLIVDFQSDSGLLPFRFVRFTKTCMKQPITKPNNNQSGNISNIIRKPHSLPFQTSHTAKATHMPPPK